jgi:hypothetical protein
MTTSPSWFCFWEKSDISGLSSPRPDLDSRKSTKPRRQITASTRFRAFSLPPSAFRVSWNFLAEFLGFVHHLHQYDVQTCNIVICGNARSFLLCWYCDHGIVLQNPDHHPAAHVHVYRSCNGKGAHCERDTNLELQVALKAKQTFYCRAPSSHTSLVPSWNWRSPLSIVFSVC